MKNWRNKESYESNRKIKGHVVVHSRVKMKKKEEKRMKIDQNEKIGSLGTKEQKDVKMEGLGWNWHD